MYVSIINTETELHNTHKQKGLTVSHWNGYRYF